MCMLVPTCKGQAYLIEIAPSRVCPWSTVTIFRSISCLADAREARCEIRDKNGHRNGTQQHLFKWQSRVYVVTSMTQDGVLYSRQGRRVHARLVKLRFVQCLFRLHPLFRRRCCLMLTLGVEFQRMFNRVYLFERSKTLLDIVFRTRQGGRVQTRLVKLRCALCLVKLHPRYRQFCGPCYLILLLGVEFQRIFERIKTLLRLVQFALRSPDFKSCCICTLLTLQDRWDVRVLVTVEGSYPNGQWWRLFTQMQDGRGS